MRPRTASPQGEEGQMDGMEAQNDDAKNEFRKAVIYEKGEGQEEKLETIQKRIEEATGKVAHTAKSIETRQ